MKFAIAAVAIVAALAALIFRPPHPVDAITVQSPSPQQRASRIFRTATPSIVVYVAGEVARPGVYRFAAEARATDAIARAGGVKPGADIVAVNLAAPLHDGDEIAVPKEGDAPRPRHSRTPARAPRSRTSRQPHVAHAEPAPQSIDLNAADESELQALPGIGPALAARIVAYRETNGPFASVDELADVSGITPNILDAIIPYATTR